jgi:hypothetical protein
VSSIFAEADAKQCGSQSRKLVVIRKDAGADQTPHVASQSDMIEAGFVGEVLSVHVSLLRDGVLSRPSHRT